MDGQADVEVVQGMYQSFGKGDIPGVLAMMADDVDWIWYGPPVIPWAGHHQGREGMARFFAKIGENVEVEAYEPREFLPGADGVVTVLGWQRVRARSTGRAWETHFAHVFTLVDGKVARAREFYDTAPIVEALTRP